MKSKNLRKTIFWLVFIVLIMLLATFLNSSIQKRMYPKKYSDIVEKYSAEYNVPEYIIYSVIYVESGFDESAVSNSGACGLMQLMPKTYAWLVEINNEEEKDIFDIEENIKYGAYYLSFLYDRYGNWEISFAAYNAGMGNVDSWLDEKIYEIKFPETKNYVDKLRVVTEKYKKIYYQKENI